MASFEVIIEMFPLAPIVAIGTLIIASIMKLVKILVCVQLAIKGQLKIVVTLAGVNYYTKVVSFIAQQNHNLKQCLGIRLLKN